MIGCTWCEWGDGVRGMLGSGVSECRLGGINGDYRVE